MADPRPAPFFIADALALDFLNSIATPVDTPVEWLVSGEDLLNWLQAAELVPTEVLTTMRRTVVPGELEAVAAQARAIERTVVSDDGAVWRPAAIAPNRLPTASASGEPAESPTVARLNPLSR